MSLSRQMKRHQERLARKGVKPHRIGSLTGSAPAPKVDPNAERLVSCAFYRYPPKFDGDPVLHKGFKSHADLRRSLGDEDPYTQPKTDRCGFWTSKDRFVSRATAVEIGQNCGQVPARFGRELLSSDIIWGAS
jgi:hypothetical protein